MSDITERLRARPTFTPHDQALLADAAETIDSLRREVHNLNWALGTEGYETMATPEEQAEADAAHASVLENIERMKARRARWEALLPDGQDPLDAIESRDATIAELRAEVAVLQMACGRWERALEHGAERVRNAENKCDSLRAQVEALRADAERLDWIDSLTNRAASSDMHMAHGRVALYVRTGIGSQIECQGWGSVRGAIDAARPQEAAG